MFNFFAYCWVLKFSVKEWLDDYIEEEFETEHEFDYDNPSF